MAHTVRRRPNWYFAEGAAFLQPYMTTERCASMDHGSCWCCSQKRQRQGRPRLKRMKHSDRLRWERGSDPTPTS